MLRNIRHSSKLNRDPRLSFSWLMAFNFRNFLLIEKYHPRVSCQTTKSPKTTDSVHFVPIFHVLTLNDSGKAGRVTHDTDVELLDESLLDAQLIELDDIRKNALNNEL